MTETVKDFLDALLVLVFLILIILFGVAVVALLLFSVAWLLGSFYALLWNASFGSVGFVTLQWWHYPLVIVLTFVANVLYAFTRRSYPRQTIVFPYSQI